MEGKSYDITALGECLIDMISDSASKGRLHFAGNPGGAPANMLAAASAFGKRCAFIGKVGADMFGRCLIDAYSEAGIDTSGMVVSEREHTTLAVVLLDDSGNRDFFFYRNATADCMLRADEVDLTLVTGAKIFHFGSISLTSAPSREATIYSIDAAKRSGSLISFDPNYRAVLWENENSARTAMRLGLERSDLVKLSEDELYMFTGSDNLKKAAPSLLDSCGITLLTVTKGKYGAECFAKNGLHVSVPAYNVKTVDTTGAGDAFWGAFLSALLDSGFSPDLLDAAQLEEILLTASACGSLSTTKYGAIPAMPSRDEVLACVRGAEYLEN